MKDQLLWRGVVILGVLALALFLAFPLQDSVRLGLDLRGGIHLVLEVQAEDALRAETDKDLDTLLRELRDQDGFAAVSATRVPCPEAEPECSDNFNAFWVEGVAASSDDEVRKIAGSLLPGWNLRREDTRLRFDRGMAEVSDIRDQSVRQALQTIRNRIDAYGVAEPVIQRQGLGGNRIVMQLPGVDDPERVKELIKNTAFLEFRFVVYPSQGAAASADEILANYDGQLPTDVQIFPQDRRDPDDGRILGTGYFALEQRQILTGRDLRTARAGLGQFNTPIVLFSVKQEAAERFGEATGGNIGRRMAIVLDGKVQSAPVIEGRITSDGQIEGQFTSAEVEDLVTVLRSGSLPAGIKYLEDRAVGPSLGQDSIDQGLRAGLVGGVLVVLTMLLVYRRTGVNAVLALAFNVVLVFAILAYFGAALTLPGIAGIILTVGMAVDANVLIFERIKEEMRAGRTVRAAISSGFGKAFSSILDANVTTLIAAMFLFQFGTGAIRGFALTLSIGILASLFTAVFGSRWIFDLLLRGRTRVERLSI